MHLLLFRVARQLCAVRVEQVQEIVHAAATIHIPGQPSIVEGFLNLRGSPIAVVPLARLFGDEAPPQRLYDVIIVVRGGSVLVGFRADAVLGVIPVEDSALEPVTAADSLNGCAEAQFAAPEGAATLLSTGRLLLEKEQLCVSDLAEQARGRLEALGNTGA